MGFMEIYVYKSISETEKNIKKIINENCLFVL